MEQDSGNVSTESFILLVIGEQYARPSILNFENNFRMARINLSCLQKV